MKMCYHSDLINYSHNLNSQWVETLVQITRVLKVWGLWFCDLIFDENDKGGDENVRHF